MPLKPREQIAAKAREPARLRDILERIDTAWSAIIDDRGMGCDCGPPGTGEACDVCEISYLLRLALDGEDRDDVSLSEWLDRRESEVSEGHSTISRTEAMRRWEQHRDR